MGFLDPQDGLKILDVGGVQKLWQRIRRDESQAQRENIKLKRMDPAQATEFTQKWEVLTQAGQSPMVDQQTGQPLAPPSLLPVNSWDNHDVHITQHNDFRKSQSFELLPQEIKDQFEAHVNGHLMAIQEAYAQAVGMQAQMGGMGPSGPPNAGGSQHLNIPGVPPVAPPGLSQPPDMGTSAPNGMGPP